MTFRNEGQLTWTRHSFVEAAQRNLRRSDPGGALTSAIGGSLAATRSSSFCGDFCGGNSLAAARASARGGNILNIKLTEAVFGLIHVSYSSTLPLVIRKF